MSASRLPSLRWLGLAFEGGLGVLAYLMGWALGVPPLATLSWDWSAVAIGLLACLPMLGLFAFCLWCPLGPFQRMRGLVDEFLVPLFADCNTLDLFLLSAAAGLGEEMLFRGFLQAGLADQFDPLTGLIVASLLFGLVHALTPTYAVMAALMGVYLGGLWLYTGSLLTVVIAHGVYDFVALVVLIRKTRIEDGGSRMEGEPKIEHGESRMEDEGG